MAEKKSFPLRIDPRLYEVLERWAADEFRSVNAQIEYVLRTAALKAGRLPKGYDTGRKQAAFSESDK